MSESRNSSESRSYGYTPSYNSYSSESRSSGESRSIYPSYQRTNYSSESRDCGESKSQRTSTPIKQESSPKYNNLEDIDKLIEYLENSLPANNFGSQRFNQALDKRKRQIEELKKLSAEAKRQTEEERITRQLEEENEEIDSQIEDVKRLLLTPKKNKKNSQGSSSSSSESRW